MKRIIMSLILMITVSISAFSQSPKAEAKAENKMEKLSEWIEAGNADVALSDDQEAKIEELYAQMRKEINDLKDDYPEKSADFDKQRKKISKEYNKQINKDILSKEQRKAKRKGKKMMKNS